MIRNAVKRSISRKFMLAVLATTSAALLVASMAMLAFDIREYQTTWINDLTTQSDILAQVSMPALEFDDAEVANENLSQLKVRDKIFAAAIYRPDGTLFATYSKSGAPPFRFPPMPKDVGYAVDASKVEVFSGIARNGETLGMVYLGAEYPLSTQVMRYLTILAAVMAASLLIALLVSMWLQAAVTKPIVALTNAVNHVIGRRDFSMRVAKSTEDEIGILVDAFNSMLAEVGDRAKALEESNQALRLEMDERLAAEEALRQLNMTLEDRIIERTVELERAHAQLRQSQKLEAVGQLTGGVAHDFNNVLQVISGNLQLLQMSLASDADAQRRLQTAAYAADRGAKLSSQLLAFARRQPLKPVPINLSRILRGMDDLLRRALGESVEIETVVAGGLWTTLVDPNQLENVILNLAINARDAMKGDGKLTLELGNAMLDDHYVSTEPDVLAGQYVMLAISDTGSGMTPEVLARAFEPFFTTKREGEGTGLGLSMAYGFVKQSNGHIRIYSEVGVGTTIRIYLPRSTQPEVTVSPQADTRITGGTETILVVEDDAVVQATVIDMLSQLGYTILKASDGQSALRILQSGVFIDLLFTDVVMPGPVRSTDLAKQAKQLFPEIEVLFTSGYTQNAIVHGGRLDPGVELLSKPYRREELARKIRYMLSSKRSRALRKTGVLPALSDGVPATAQLRVLVVEDDDDARASLCELLALLGHHVEGFPSAELALDRLASAYFDILLTDLTLPGMSGLDLARKIIQKGIHLHVVFSTGHASFANENIDIKAAFLPKPFKLESLQKVFESVIEVRSPLS